MVHTVRVYTYGTTVRIWYGYLYCHDINGPGISGPGGPFMFDTNGPPRPFMLSQMAPLDHLCQNINGPGKTA